MRSRENYSEKIYTELLNLLKDYKNICFLRINVLKMKISFWISTRSRFSVDRVERNINKMYLQKKIILI